MKLALVPMLLLLALPAHAATSPVHAAAKPPARPAAAPSATDPAALLDQARDAQARGDMELALRLAQAAIVADPARPSSYVALGDLYSAQGEGEYARAYYEAALEIDPADAGALRAEALLGNPKATAANR